MRLLVLAVGSLVALALAAAPAQAKTCSVKGSSFLYSLHVKHAPCKKSKRLARGWAHKAACEPISDGDPGYPGADGSGSSEARFPRCKVGSYRCHSHLGSVNPPSYEVRCARKKGRVVKFRIDAGY